LNSAGAIESVASGIPRLDYATSGGTVGCPALLVEPAATNQIRNNSMSGAVTGTPGTLPTGGGWSNTLLGLTQTIIGTGTENGISYIDIRFSGTATTTDVVETRYESTTQIDAASGQTWTHSVYLKKIAEPNPPSNYQLNIYERAVAGGYVANGASTVVPTTTNLQRFSQTRTLSGALTAKVQPCLFYSVVSGTAYNFTIRIGYPQMETGSVATSVIPTTTAAVTRNADVISVTGAVSGSVGQTEGTVYAEVDIRNLGYNGAILTLQTDNWITNSIQIQKSLGNQWRFTIRAASTVILNVDVGTITAGIHKVALGYNTATSGTVLAVNGSILSTQTASSIPACNSIVLGTRNETGTFTIHLNDRIRAVALYTTKLSNAELATLTTP